MSRKRILCLGALGTSAFLLPIAYIYLAGSADTRTNEPTAGHAGASTVERQDSGRQDTSGENAVFRDRVAAFVRQVTAGTAAPQCMDEPVTNNDWQIDISVHHRGTVAGHGVARNTSLCAALQEATQRAVSTSGLGPAALAEARLAIDFPGRKYSIIEHGGTGHELVRGLVPVRVLDRALVRQRVEQGKEYLFRVIDTTHPDGRGGVHKYYHAPEDRFEPRLHTIYTASLVYTLLGLRAIDDDERIPAHIENSTAFLLSMQSRGSGPADESHGGFFYSYDLETGAPEQKLVVGTTAKTIFTLLALHRSTADDKYMESARLAADWLLRMQNRDGSIKPFLVRHDDRWAYPQKESLLYTGQVLSALSRMYTATRDTQYLDAADLTARRLMHQVSKQGCYLGDDYRKPNPISSSWAILSLFDFLRATGNRRAGDVAFRCADELLRRQIDNPRDAYRHGRWRRSLSSSGNGWLSEVYAELYRHCRDNQGKRCERYEQAIVKSLRYVAQHTYTPASAFAARNPDAAMGGLFWNTSEPYVRTDAVCHAMNAYIAMLEHFDDGPLITLPEPPLAERLAPAP